MNKRQRNTLIAGSAVVLAGVLFLTRAAPPTAVESFAAVSELLAQEHYDEQYALARLDACLAQAEAESDGEVAANVLMARGTLLLEIGATDGARDDYTAVLERHRPGDPEARRLLARTEEAAGDYEAARAALSALLLDHPEYGRGWVEAGLLEQRLARARLDQCAREISFALVGDDAAQARKLTERIAASDISDPSRITAAFELRRLFPPDADVLLAICLELADEASKLYAAARDNYVRSFEHGVVPDAVAGYIAILVAADEVDAALDFGLISLSRPELAGHARSAAILIEALLARGDNAWAANIAEQWVGQDAPFELDFLFLLARALREGRRWPALQNCLSRISKIGVNADSNLMTVYRGLALSGLDQLGPALGALRRFVRSDAEDPFPGARALAWREVARICEQRRDPAGEREALHELLRIDPDAGGRLWLRIAELHLQARHAGYALPLDAWTRAMCALPRQTEQLLPGFLELGEKALAAENKDLELTLRELGLQNRIVPRTDTNPYLLYGLALRHSEADNAYGVRVLTELLLEHHPGFVPALDLLIGAELALAKRAEAAEHYVQRLELVGPDARSHELSPRFASHAFSADQEVRLMTADPDGIGRRAVARNMIARGDRAGALRVLQSGTSEDPSALEVELYARLLLEEGRSEDALAELMRIQRDSPGFFKVAALVVEAALSVGDVEEALSATEVVTAGKGRDKQALLELSTTLLRLGQPDAAGSILRQLDAGSARDGRVLISLALAALAAGNIDSAATYVERAEAFVTPEIGGLTRALIAARRGDSFTLERELRGLVARGGFERGPRAAAAAILVDDAGRALELAVDPERADPTALSWILLEAAARYARGEPFEAPAELGPAGTTQTRAFVRGSELEPSDPRAAALALLALEIEPLAAYVAGELHALDPSARGALWPRLLEARALGTLGLHSAARLELTRLLEDFPACEAAWRELERAERLRLRFPHHPELVALAARHLRALGSARPESPEGLLLRARTALSEGRADTAEALARRTLEKRATWDEARATLATALARQGRSEESLAAWASALLDAPPARAAALVEGFLEALAIGERTGAITPTEAFPALDSFAKALPEDPRLVLALAERELARDDQNPSIGYARALSRLETFRLQHGARSLDDLHPGSTAAWARFYVQLDPLEGRRFLEAERRRDPGNLELWVLLGRVLRQSGDTRGALELIARASRMAPEASVFEEIAAAQVSAGGDPRAVRAPLERVRQLQGRRKLDLAAQLLIAKARLRQSARGASERAVSELEPFWEEREGLARERRNELAFVLAQALLRRDWPGDRARVAELIGEWAPLESDPYRRSLAEAFLRLTPGEALRTPPPAAEGEGVEASDEELGPDEGAGDGS